MTPVIPRCAVVGRGRLGSALAAALPGAIGPLGRDDAVPPESEVVILAVPDAAIAQAAARVPAGPLVGHCSGATTLAPLQPHEAFGLHPLMTVTADGADFRGATCAVAGTTDRALQTARALAAALGMTPFEVADEDRAAYHAAASMASNFLVTLEWAAQRVGGLDREALAPLVRATVENWAAGGPQRALTGPIARGDELTVQRQRAAVAQRAPDLLPLFDALAAATRDLAGRPRDTEAAA